MANRYNLTDEQIEAIRNKYGSRKIYPTIELALKDSLYCEMPSKVKGGYKLVMISDYEPWGLRDKYLERINDPQRQSKELYGWGWKSWKDQYMVHFDTTAEAQAWLHTEACDGYDRELLTEEEARERIGDAFDDWDTDGRLAFVALRYRSCD